MEKSTLKMLFRAPLVLLMVITFIGIVYAAAKGIEPVHWSHAFIVGIVLVLYFIGEFMKDDKMF